MKCVAVGDVFITPEMMKDAVERMPQLVDSCQYFFFGFTNRKGMRDTVKTIERYGRDELDLPDGYLEAVEDAEILMVHLCPVTTRVLDQAKKLKYILCNRGGIENIDIETATARGIKVISNPAHNANAVAEYVVGLIFSETRNIARAHHAIKAGEWREKFPNSGRIIELKDLTVGVVGFGNIGELVCEKLSAFGCQMLVTNLFVPTERNPKIAWDRVHFVELDELIAKSDIITLHVRSKDQKPLFARKQFEMMKSTAYLINTARPYLIDMPALYEALSGQQIAGAAIDVFEVEPLGPSYPFLNLDNVTLTNHRAGDTVNAYSDSPMMMFGYLDAWLKTGKPPKFLKN